MCATKGERREKVNHPRPSEIVPVGRNSGPNGAAVLNAKQEKYAHFRALGKTQAEAAKLAGYSGHAANASRLEGITAVSERIQELKKKYVGQSEVRVELEKAELRSLIDNEKLDVSYFVTELRANLTLAREDRDVKASNECLKLMMELLGFMGAKGTKDKPNALDPRTPVKVSIINQLANGLNNQDRNTPAHGGTLTAETVPSALPDLSDGNAEFEPDFGLLESAFGDDTD